MSFFNTSVCHVDTTFINMHENTEVSAPMPWSPTEVCLKVKPAKGSFLQYPCSPRASSSVQGCACFPEFLQSFSER